MRIIFSLLACFITLALNAQNEIKIFPENKNPGYTLYASNSALCPISVVLELNLENLKFSETQKIFVIPAKADKFKIGELDVLNLKEKYKFGFHTKYNFGDITLLTGDTSYVYDLPFQKGKSFRLFQGYNGNFSHQNENALDFTMPEGIEVYAARDGIVIKVVQENNEACPREECKKFNNFITVYHADGSFAEYTHIRYNGSKVKPGDIIKKGDHIAYSGNTGWSSGPHLHFVCYLAGIEKRRSIPTKFRIDDGKNVGYLKEKETYTKGY